MLAGDTLREYVQARATVTPTVLVPLLFGLGIIGSTVRTISTVTLSQAGLLIAVGPVVFPGLVLTGCTLVLAFGSFRQPEVRRIVGWSLVGAFALVAVMGFIMAYQQLHDVTLAEPFVAITWIAGIGAVGGFLTGVYDVRNERRAESLNVARERFDSAIEAAPLAIIALDRDKTITTWNRGAEELFGWSAAEALGESYPTLHGQSLIPPDRREAYERRRQTVKDGETVSRVETKRQCKDGTRVDVSIWATPVLVDGTQTGQMIAVADITEQKQTEERLSVLNRLLRHNVRNAVTIIYGHVDQLRADRSERQDNTERSRESLATIEEYAGALESVAQKASSISQALEETDAGPVAVADAVAVGQSRIEAEYPDVRIETAIPAGLFVRGGAIETAIEEAIRNAIEHANTTPAICVRAEGTDEGTVELQIEDDGPGIPDHERRVLEGGTESKLQHGSGIGLWLMKWIVEHCGGAISITENDDGGTTVVFILPAVSPDQQNTHPAATSE